MCVRVCPLCAYWLLRVTSSLNKGGVVASNNYHPQTKFAKVMFFTPVYHSIHRRVSRSTPRGEVERSRGVSRPPPRGGLGGSGWGASRPTPRGVQAHAWGVRGVSPGPSWEWIPACTEADTTPLQQTTTAAGGTHPTGMHSCLQFLWKVTT